MEQQAHNGGYTRLDVKGCTADACCCVDGADDVIIAGLDMKTVCDDVNCSGSKAKAEISHDPGRYEMNHVPCYDKTCLCHMRTQWRRSACASAQSDQYLCWSLPRQYNTYRCYTQNFKILASFWSWVDQFVSYLFAHLGRQVFSWWGSNKDVDIILALKIKSVSTKIKIWCNEIFWEKTSQNM